MQLGQPCMRSSFIDRTFQDILPRLRHVHNGHVLKTSQSVLKGSVTKIAMHRWLALLHLLLVYNAHIR